MVLSLRVCEKEVNFSECKGEQKNEKVYVQIWDDLGSPPVCIVSL